MAYRLAEWAYCIPLWVWALVLGIGSLVAAFAFAMCGWGFGHVPGRRLFAYCSVAAIILGLVGAAKDPENWRAGMTASAIGGLGMVAWSILRILLGGPLGE